MRDAIASDGLLPQVTFRRDTRHHPSNPIGVRRSGEQMDLAFVAPVLATPTRELYGLVRGTDPIESQRAGLDVKGKLTKIQGQIMAILAECGPLNAKDIETHKDLRGYSPSTARKRISELSKMEPPKIVQVGRKDGCAVWAIAGTADVR